MFSADSLASSADYRRRARRIRASFAGDSFLTQSALRDLARKRNLEIGQEISQQSEQTAETKRRMASAARRTPFSSNLGPGLAGQSPSVLQLRIDAVVERGFAEHALTKLQPFGFTFSDRAALLDAAEKLGISRFRANLILAMQENTALQRRSVTPPPQPASNTPYLLLIVAMEIIGMALLAWWLMR
jgi:hypothetical protein